MSAGLHLSKEARLLNADAQQQERQAHHAADEIRGAPVEPFTDDERRDCAADTNGRDERRRVAARLPRHQLRDQRDAGAQLSREADARDETQRGVLRHRHHPGVEQVGNRIEHDGAEQHRQAAALVAEHAPHDPADQHPGHLHVQEHHAGRKNLVGRHADVTQAWHADDAEQDQIVDIDEVAERGDKNGQRQGPASDWTDHRRALSSIPERQATRWLRRVRPGRHPPRTTIGDCVRAAAGDTKDAHDGVGAGARGINCSGQAARGLVCGNRRRAVNGGQLRRQ